MLRSYTYLISAGLAALFAFFLWNMNVQPPMDKVLVAGVIKAIAMEPHRSIGAVLTWKRELCVFRINGTDVTVAFTHKLLHPSYFQPVAFHISEPLLAVCLFEVLPVEDPNIIVLSSNDGSVVAQAHGHEGMVAAVKFSSDGQELITSGTNGKVELEEQGELRFWDPQTLKESRTALPLRAMAECISVTSVAHVFAVGDCLGSVHVWDEQSLRPITSWKEQQSSGVSAGIKSLQFNRDGTNVLCAGGHGISLRDARSGAILASHRSASMCFSGAFLDSGEQLVAFTDETGLFVWNLAIGESTRVRRFPPDTNGLLEVNSRSGYVYLAVGKRIETIPVQSLTKQSSVQRLP